MSTLIIILIIAGIALLWFFSIYNKFVALKAQIEASIQEIGNQLKRQADLIPNLVDSVKGYMKHEKEIFKEITDARKQVLETVGGGNAKEMVEASTRMEQALAPIRALFESTPQLQAAAPTQKLMDELRDTADKVMYSRRTLIDITLDYNTMVVTVPSNFIASLFHFEKQPGLATPVAGEHIEVSSAELRSPKVEL